MRKGKSIIGLKVISQADATDLGTVKDLVFDHEADELIALLISEKDLFGLIDAQVVPWSQVQTIGPDAIMAASRESKMKSGDDPRVKAVMGRDTALSGTRIMTTDGQDIGALADMYIDDVTGRIVGYEVSGGFFSDTVSGKRFMSSPSSLSIGTDKVALVPPEVLAEFEAQKQNQPGGLQGAAGAVSTSVTSAYGTAKDKVTDTYASVASASVDKQKIFVIGKVAGQDVLLPASAGGTIVVPGDAGFSEISATPELSTSSPTTLAGTEAAPLATTSSTSPSIGEVLVHKGETITSVQADRAESAGILHQLLLAVGSGAVSAAAGSASAAGSSAVASVGSSVSAHTRNAVVGQVAGREVTVADGSTLVAPGMVITEAIYERAQLMGKETELAAAAGAGAATSSADAVRDHAGNLWDSIKHKAAELTGAAHEKKAEMDARSEQTKINNALGRPVTRVILDRTDKVILNTGDLITNAAVEQARTARVLEILLDSVYQANPEITPEMLRVREPGEAALDSQAQPSGGPIVTAAPPVAEVPEGTS